MANELDLVFKKVVGRQYTTTAKEWYEEYPTPPFNLNAEDVWIDPIPSTPPATTISGITVYNTLTLQEDVTVNGKQCWVAEDPIGTRIGDFIHPRYGQGYSGRLFDGSNSEIPTTDVINWFFDYTTGILTFDDDPGDHGWDNSSFKIKAYRYIGRTVVNLSTLSGSLYASDILNDSSISGATVKEALEWLDSNKVSYNFGNNTISGTGDIYAGSYYGDGSHLTGITASGVDVSRFKYNQTPTVVSGTKVYSLPDIPVAGTDQIYVNGLLQEPGVGSDYIISGKIITFTEDLAIDDILLASYITD